MPAGNSEYEPAITAIPATKTSHVDFGCQQWLVGYSANQISQLRYPTINSDYRIDNSNQKSDIPSTFRQQAPFRIYSSIITYIGIWFE